MFFEESEQHTTTTETTTENPSNSIGVRKSEQRLLEYASPTEKRERKSFKFGTYTPKQEKLKVDISKSQAFCLPVWCIVWKLVYTGE